MGEIAAGLSYVVMFMVAALISLTMLSVAAAAIFRAYYREKQRHLEEMLKLGLDNEKERED